MSVDRKDLDELEETMYDCWCITADIKKTLDVSDNIEDDVRALMKVYDIKFKVLANNVDEVDNNLTNLRETWEEMRPDRVAERMKLEKQLDLFEVENVGC